MLVELFKYLNSLDFPGARMFQYISFRSSIAFILSMFIATTIGKRIIAKLQRMQIGETIRDLDLEGQMSKKGTPTMGGVIILAAILIPVLPLQSGLIVAILAGMGYGAWRDRPEPGEAR